MNLALYFILAFMLLLFAYFVFRRIVRRDYEVRGRLSGWISFFQLLVFLAYFCFPYLFSPPGWPWFWTLGGSASPAWREVVGIILLSIGFVVSFGTMAWFGTGRAFGVTVDGLKRSGPYKFSRNPQVLGGYLLVMGTFLQWPTFLMMVWVLMYALITHWMIQTEEENLGRVFGEAYKKYCSETPRYLFRF